MFGDGSIMNVHRRFLRVPLERFDDTHVRVTGALATGKTDGQIKESVLDHFAKLEKKRETELASFRRKLMEFKDAEAAKEDAKKQLEVEQKLEVKSCSSSDSDSSDGVDCEAVGKTKKGRPTKAKSEENLKRRLKALQTK
jgi:hypothetical protein